MYTTDLQQGNNDNQTCNITITTVRILPIFVRAVMIIKHSTSQ